MSRRQEHEIGQQGDDGGLLLFLPGQKGRDAHAEHHAEILDDGHHPVVGQAACQGQRLPAQDGRHRPQPRRGQQGPRSQHKARRRQIPQSGQHGGGKLLQRAHDPFLLLHGRPSFPARSEPIIPGAKTLVNRQQVA